MFQMQDARGFFYFNPRSREGSDTAYRTRIPDNLYFNPRSREGSDALLCLSLPDRY